MEANKVNLQHVHLPLYLFYLFPYLLPFLSLPCLLLPTGLVLEMSKAI